MKGGEATEARRPAADVPAATLEVGPRGAWTGTFVYLIPLTVYVLAVAFETRAIEGHPTWVELGEAFGPARFSLGESAASLEWRTAVLVLIGAAVAAAAPSAALCYEAFRRARAPVLYMAGMLLFAVWFASKLTEEDNPSTLLLQMVRLLAVPGSDVGAADVAGFVMWPKRGAEGVAGLVGLGAASVLVLPRRIDAAWLASSMRALKILLYTSAVLFVSGIWMTETAYEWLASFLSPEAEDAKRALVEWAPAGTRLAGAFYTVVLAAVYLPVAAVLAVLARRLAERAAPAQDETPDAWLKGRGLSISWQGQLTRIAALAAPIVSSAVANALAAAPV